MSSKDIKSQQRTPVLKAEEAPENAESLLSEEAELKEELSRRIGALVPKGQRDQIVSQVFGVVRQEKFSGPIAHPRHLREYEEICPGAADRIIGMAEDEAKHRQELEKIVVGGDVNDQKLGQVLGFSALALLAIGAMVSVYVGSDMGTGLFLGTGALGTIGVFIKGRATGEKP
ncbi:MAG: DUF2335 domain-containing protein [Rhizobiales bacterium]|nr:DUF2335 domain-containing protein [Hyphomicrobiales bacterium]